MEVAYALLGDFAGPSRVRAVYRLPENAAAGVAFDDAVIADIQCHVDACAISRVAKRAGDAPLTGAMTIAAHIVRMDAPAHQVILMPDAFPTEVPQALSEQLEMRADRTKIVAVAFVPSAHGLVFRDLRLIGEENREPVKWK